MDIDNEVKNIICELITIRGKCFEKARADRGEDPSHASNPFMVVGQCDSIDAILKSMQEQVRIINKI